MPDSDLHKAEEFSEEVEQTLAEEEVEAVEFVDDDEPVGEVVTDLEAAEQTGSIFVREPKSRLTQPPISDESLYAEVADYTHDSDFTNDGIAIAGKGYKRSQSDMGTLQRDLHYGQYLEIPKGRRDIFVSRERSTRVKTFIALLLLLALLAAAAYFVVIFLQSQFG